MIIEKKIKLQVNAGVSTSGASGRYLNVDISNESIDIEDILNDIRIFLLSNYLYADIEDMIASEDGIHIRIHADIVEDNGISSTEYSNKVLKGVILDEVK